MNHLLDMLDGPYRLRWNQRPIVRDVIQRTIWLVTWRLGWRCDPAIRWIEERQ